MKQDLSVNVNDLATTLKLETALERQLLQDVTFAEGLRWGVPRYGHPEGEVYKHIAEVFANIDKLDIDPLTRRRLRIIALVHDTFKHLEDKNYPRDWTKHHGVFARRFAEQHIHDPLLLDIIEWHDEAYYIWRLKYLYNQPAEADKRLARLLDRIGDELQLYYLFFKCDTCTGDKNPAPLQWFEKSISGIDIVEL